MTPAVMAEGPFSGYGYRTYVGVHDWFEKAQMIHGEVTEETKAKTKYGAGMMVAMRRDKGEVRHRRNMRMGYGAEAQLLLHAADHPQYPGSVY